ncbi:single-stranded DNA-binding protein [Pseudolysinimonas sp.]|jgi:single-strand DNA-binding protein|uniref:single-stranded DNA-binding protein n=1 Tax=Pseudolysinimonas sp. TaxID=2680009 RepID=UPI0037847987
MSDQITLTGLVATPPKHIVTSEGLQITSFRLASTQRRFNRAEQKWEDADTNWYTVTAFRTLAANAIGSILKGQRVIVSGRLRIREWQTDEKSGTTIEVDADSLGHDLTFGTSSFTRTPQATAAADTPETAAAAEQIPASPEAPDPDVADAPVDDLAEARAKRPSELPVPF